VRKRTLFDLDGIWLRGGAGDIRLGGARDGIRLGGVLEVIGILSGRVSWAANFLGSAKTVIEVCATRIGSVGGGVPDLIRGRTGMEAGIVRDRVLEWAARIGVTIMS
jgi:hypothetical protein